MTKYTINAPEPRFNGEVAGLVFRAGKAAAETPADQAAVTYCQRRGYTVVPGDGVSQEGEQADAETLDTDAVDDGDTANRPADYASKADWVAYAVDRGASEADAQAATKNELIELYG